jgi:hypothetical protein
MTNIYLCGYNKFRLPQKSKMHTFDDCYCSEIKWERGGGGRRVCKRAGCWCVHKADAHSPGLFELFILFLYYSINPRRLICKFHLFAVLLFIDTLCNLAWKIECFFSHTSKISTTPKKNFKYCYNVEKQP